MRSVRVLLRFDFCRFSCLSSSYCPYTEFLTGKFLQSVILKNPESHRTSHRNEVLPVIAACQVCWWAHTILFLLLSLISLCYQHGPTASYASASQYFQRRQCLSVCPCVCYTPVLSQSEEMIFWFLHCRRAWTFWFLKISGSSRNSKEVTGRFMRLRWIRTGNFGDFSTYKSRIRETVQDGTKVAIDH